jgi:hypothetical protein
MATTLEKIDNLISHLNRTIGIGNKFKIDANALEWTKLAIEATKMRDSATELRRIFEEQRSMYIDKKVEKGEMTRIPVEDLRPKLRIVPKRKGV